MLQMTGMTGSVMLWCLLWVVLVGGELPVWRSGAMDAKKMAFNSTARPCKIVVRDNIKGFLNWQQDWFIKAAASKGISIIPNSKMVMDADVLLFHAPTHTHRVSPITSSASVKTPMKVMVSMEQPKYAPVFADTAYLQATMHLLVTYSLAAVYPSTSIPNLPITYYPSHILSPSAVLTAPRAQQTGYSTGVTVATFTSNCANAGAKERFKYLEELMRHIPVHSYGACLHNRDEPEMANDPNWPPIAQRRARKIAVLSNYKFYLAFENLAVDDYVSEKVFEGLVAGAVPVYRGAASIRRFMPADDSFIDANALSPKQLADLLKSLATDSKAYAAYMAFKQRPLSASFLQISNMSYVHPNVVSRICDVAHAWQDKQKMKRDGKM